MHVLLLPNLIEQHEKHWTGTQGRGGRGGRRTAFANVLVTLPEKRIFRLADLDGF